MILAESVINSPVVVTLIGVAAAALVTMAAAAMRMVIKLAQMQTELAAIRQDISDLKTDPDVMRWSNYGRAAQAFSQIPSGPVIQP